MIKNLQMDNEDSYNEGISKYEFEDLRSYKCSFGLHCVFL
jgi:hypothetical protein